MDDIYTILGELADLKTRVQAFSLMTEKWIDETESSELLTTQSLFTYTATRLEKIVQQLDSYLLTQRQKNSKRVSQNCDMLPSR